MAYRQQLKLPSLRVTRRSSSGTVTWSVVKRGKVEPTKAQTVSVNNSMDHDVADQPMEVCKIHIYSEYTCSLNED